MSKYYRSFLEESGVVYTARTTAFATATAITDTTILNALNTFDLGLISNGLDTYMDAIYPFVGNTSTTNKFNFINPVDSDGAFRLVFSGGVTFDSTGVTFNGINGYANTKWIPSVNASGDGTNGSIGYYLRNNYTDNKHTSLISSGNYFGIWQSISQIYPSINDANVAGYAPIRYKGFFQVSRSNSTTVISSVDTTQTTKTANVGALANGFLPIGATTSGSGLNGAVGTYANANVGFFYISRNKFSLPQQLTLNTLVSSLMTTLSRNV